MSGQKALTVDQLIVLSGLNKSPDEIVHRARKRYENTHQSIINPSSIRGLLNQYVEWRLKDLATDRSWMVTLLASFVGILLPVAFIAHEFVGCAALSVQTMLMFFRSRDNIKAMKKTSEVTGLVATYRESLPHQIGFVWRNGLLSPFDLFLVHQKKRLDSQTNKERRAATEPFDPEVSLRETYLNGLKKVEAELIGPNSDWSKSLVDLKARLEKTKQLKERVTARIQLAKNAGDDERFDALEGSRARLVSTERSLNAAIESISNLINKTQAELNKLHVFVDSIGAIYQDAELIKEADASLDASEDAIDHAQLLQTQAHEKISRQLMAVASVVIGHKLLPNPKIEAIDMPRYLDEIEHAASAIVKISEA